MISPPNHQKDALPSRQGWRHPRTGELLVSRPLSEEQINEYLYAAGQELESEPEEIVFEDEEDEEEEDKNTIRLNFLSRWKG